MKIKKLKLDLSPLNELKKSYYQSLSLKLWGVLCYALAIPFAITSCLLLLMIEHYSFLDILFVLLCPTRAILEPISGYIFRSLRSRLARLYIRLSLVLSFIFTVLMNFSGLISAILILILIIIYSATYNPLLFGSDCFSHNQIKLAYKSLKGGGNFTDEDLIVNAAPNKQGSRVLDAGFIVLVLSYLLHFALAITLILRMFK